MIKVALYATVVHVLESYRYCPVCRLMQVQDMVCFTPSKRKKGKKEGYEYPVPPYGRDETLGRVSNFLFSVSGFCALKSSLFWIMVGRYML